MHGHLNVKIIKRVNVMKKYLVICKAWSNICSYLSRERLFFILVISDGENMMPSYLLLKHFRRQKERVANYKYFNLDSFPEKYSNM